MRIEKLAVHVFSPLLAFLASSATNIYFVFFVSVRATLREANAYHDKKL